jgi:hypothetical protein
MEVFSDSGNSFGKVPALCRYSAHRFLMWINVLGLSPAQQLQGGMRYPSRLQNSLVTGLRPMKAALVELISKISSGCMSEDEILKVADEAAQAYADQGAFLTANPDINYDDTFPMPLGEWVVVGSLPETVLFQADTYMDLFAQIVASFGPGVDFNIKPKQLAKTEALTALNRIQVQMSSMNKENGGYVLMNFSQLLDDELQVVLVYGNDVPRVLQLCAEVGIAAAPSLEALKVAIHV